MGPIVTCSTVSRFISKSIAFFFPGAAFFLYSIYLVLLGFQLGGSAFYGYYLVDQFSPFCFC